MLISNCVLIFGKSLNLAGLGAFLKQEEKLDVQFINPNNANIEKCVSELNPHVIFFDLSNPPDNLYVALFQNRPDLMLIGIDPSSDDVFMLKGQRNKVITTGELTQLIANHTG